jgi:very-short-patch-repair endonuclease
MAERTKRARELRQYAPSAERKMWSIIRDRRLDGWKFRRQVPIGRYFADFLCAEAKLIVELDGQQHAKQADYDTERKASFESYGYRVIRFSNALIMGASREVSEAILGELRSSSFRPAVP